MRTYIAASAYHVIWKEVENHIITSGTIEFLYTCVFKQPSLTKEWNYNTFVRILYSYFRYTGRLFLDVLFLLLVVIVSELHEKARRNKDWVTEKSAFLKKVQKKSTRTICVRDITFLTAHPPFYIFFVAFFIYSLPLPKWHTCWIGSIKILNIAMGV